MDKAEVRAIVENRFCELGARKMELQPSGICWTLYGDFFKVTTLKEFWVAEWTDNRTYALNDCSEDVDPMPYDISGRQIIEHVDGLLLRQN